MDKSFKEILIEALEQRGFTLEKLASESRIPKRYLELMVRGEFDSLPPAPYLHGYIARLAENLALDADLLWEIYKKENRLKISGSDDRLPINRFALQTISHTRLLVLGALFLTAALYVLLRFDALFGRPGLVVTEPPTDTTIAIRSLFTIRGSADPDVKVTVNNDLVNSGPDGSFSQDVLLEEGLNSFSIKASKFLGRETVVIRQIIFEPPASDSAEPSLAPLETDLPTPTPL